MEKSRKYWTYDEKRLILALVKEVGIDRAAEITRIKRNTLGKWVEHGITKTPPGYKRRFFTDDEKRKAVEIAQNQGVEVAGETLGIARTTIYNWLRDNQNAVDDAQIEKNAEFARNAVETATTEEINELRKTLEETKHEMVVYNATADELRIEIYNLKTAVELLTETLLDTAQAAAPLIMPTVKPGDVTC